VRHLWLHNHASHPKTEFVKNEVLNLCCDIWSVNHKLITDEEFTSDIDAGNHAVEHPDSGNCQNGLSMFHNSE